MIKVMKVLKVDDTGDEWGNRVMADRKAARAIEWVKERFPSYVKAHRGTGTNRTIVIVWFHFDDPAEATWFELAFTQDTLTEKVTA